MTGTGTQTDPYIVSTWKDFRTAMSKTGAYVELDADIDMNQVAPEGISAINVKNVVLDGKNHAIKNLVANSGFLNCSDYSYTYISNLKILNFVNRGADGFIAVAHGSSFYFRHNVLSGINASTGKVIQFYIGPVSINAYLTSTDEGGCMINVHISSGGFTNYGITINDSYIKLSGENQTDTNTWKLNNCYVEGKISGSKFDSCYNSVIDAECPENSNFTVTNCSNLLVNTDKFTGTFSDENGIKKVTSEQLTDAEYLESISFPIGVE